MGEPFQIELRALDIIPVSKTVKHTQENSIYECTYKTYGDAIRYLVHKNSQSAVETKLYMVDDVISWSQRALRLAQHITMGV